MSRILLVAPTDEFGARLTDAFGAVIDEAVGHWWNRSLIDEPVVAAAKLGAEAPSVVLLSPGVAVIDDPWSAVSMDSLIGLARELSRAHPEIAIALLTEPKMEFYASAMRAGIRDVLDPESSLGDLRTRVSDLLGVADRLRVPPAERMASQGSVVTMLEPKGGSGKTSIVSNLAVLMAERMPGRVVLLDLDLQFGDLTDALLLEPKYTIAEAARLPGVLDATTLKALLTRRNDLFVLCAPNNPADADLISPEKVGEIISLLKAEFEWVLIDTSAGLIEPALTVLERTTNLVLLASLDIFSIRNLRKTVEILDQLGVAVPNRHLVLNRSDSKVGLDRTEAVLQLGMRKAVEVPSSRQVPLSLNKGQPIVEMQPRSLVSRRIADLAEDLIATQEKLTGWSSR